MATPGTDQRRNSSVRADRERTAGSVTRDTGPRELAECAALSTFSIPRDDGVTGHVTAARRANGLRPDVDYSGAWRQLLVACPTQACGEPAGLRFPALR